MRFNLGFLEGFIVYQEAIQRYSRERNLSLQDAAQIFLQVVVLKHLSVPQARFMGGTALVLGYGNPRFSEDIDLAQLSDPNLLRPGLVKAASELEGWFACPVTLTPPKSGGRTWRLVVRLGRAESLSLHVDSQEYKVYRSQPIVIQYPSISSFVCEAMALDEILAEKVIAVAYRRYLGGRDLFDLWFHWLKDQGDSARWETIRGYLEEKLRERSLVYLEFFQKLKERLSRTAALERARSEWKRYLPADFQRPTVFEAILSSCRSLPGLLEAIPR